MSKQLSNYVLGLLGGFLLTAPFLLLEWINTPGFLSQGIPPLFFIMWLSGSIFTLVLVPLLKDLRGKNKAKLNSFSLTVKVGLLILMAWIFMGLVIDQWPCFMGVPNCD